MERVISDMERKAEHEIVPVLIGDLARALVDRPWFVKVNALKGKTLTILEVSVAPGDIGMLVGRGGRTATALRQLLFAMGGKSKIRYDLEILEPGEPVGMTGPLPDRIPATIAVVRRRQASLSTCGEDAFIQAFEHDPVRATGDLLERVVRELVDHADQVTIRAIEGIQAVVYEIHVNQRDVPRVLGRGGRTIGAAREIALNLGKKVGRRLIVEVVEPVDSTV